MSWKFIGEGDGESIVQCMRHDLSHDVSEAIELEFFIPAVVWSHPSTKEFLAAVYASVEGATIVGGAKGVWQGERETTNLVQILIRKSRIAMGPMLTDIHNGIDKMMVAWSNTEDLRQDAFMFTMRELTVCSTEWKSKKHKE